MNRRAVFIAVVVVAVLMATIGVASAQLKLTAVLNSWDNVWTRWENGMISMYLDGGWQPFYQKLDFDTDLFGGSCTTGTSMNAGAAQIGLYFQDTAPVSGQGFQKTQHWALVNCKAFETKSFVNPGDLDILATCSETDDNCKLVAVDGGFERVDNTRIADYKVPCTSKADTGNCALQIETQFAVNMDGAAPACDGVLDSRFSDPGGVCLYWEGKKPAMNPPFWKGNIQARVSYLGAEGFTGDKTINFNISGPNAVGLSRFSAGSSAFPVAAAAGLIVLVSAAVIVLPRRRR